VWCDTLIMILTSILVPIPVSFVTFKLLYNKQKKMIKNMT